MHSKGALALVALVCFILGFTMSFLLSKDYLSLAPPQEEAYYLGIFGDYIAVFQGNPETGGILLEQTDISILKIPQFEIENLRRGISFSTVEEKYSLLEGLYFPH